MDKKLMTILVDMDGPLVQFEKQFLKMCDFYGYVMHGGDVNVANPCAEHRFAADCIDDKVQRDAAYARVAAAGWFESLPAVEGAVEGLNALAAHHGVADVFLCTKPMERNPTCRDDKAEWVRHHLGDEWVRKLIISPDKGMVRGDILLDDAPKPEWIERAEWVPVIYPERWNAPDRPFAEKAGIVDAARWDWSQPIEDLLAYAAGA